MELKLKIRGRDIGSAEVSFLQEAIHLYWEKGRTYISRYICEQWDWRQANGSLKDMACRDLLLRLYRKGMIELPPSRYKTRRRNRPTKHVQLEFPPEPIESKLQSILPIKLEMVRFTPDENMFNSFVNQYHYLGYRQIIGAHAKYIAYSQGRPLACIGWGASAWKVASRDTYIGWNDEQRDARRDYIVQNTRFLILPWVRVQFLASHLLSLNARRISYDWQCLYNHPVVLLETFVDTTRFHGICYRAANWICVGETKGRGKYDRYNRCEVPVKAVYVYPLKRSFKRILCGGKGKSGRDLSRR